ncbi:hypothetical protein [Sunxiuqinia sp. sy24]|uniref:hypothetical protein n=1 Tax=Sunxiuqinia sp. sy24 TaxID=3461495 RepID=UPI004045D190
MQKTRAERDLTWSDGIPLRFFTIFRGMMLCCCGCEAFRLGYVLFSRGLLHATPALAGLKTVSSRFF